MGIAGMIIGIIGLFAPLPIFLLGLPLSIKGMNNENQKGMAIAGVVMNSIALACWVVILGILFTIAFFFGSFERV